MDCATCGQPLLLIIPGRAQCARCAPAAYRLLTVDPVTSEITVWTMEEEAAAEIEPYDNRPSPDEV